MYLLDKWELIKVYYFLCACEWKSSKNDQHFVVFMCILVTYLSMEFSTAAMNGRHSFSPFLITAVVKLSSGGLALLVFLE